MYEIATLKEKKLADLQEIAKNLGLKRTSALKKLDLIYQIIDHISANPPEKKESPAKSEGKKEAVKTAPKTIDLNEKNILKKIKNKEKLFKRKKRTRNLEESQKMLKGTIKSDLTTDLNTRIKTTTKIINRTTINTHVIKSKR
jgi:transcription termination factor Rho